MAEVLTRVPHIQKPKNVKLLSLKQETWVPAILEEKTACGKRERAQSHDKGNRRNYSRSAKIQGLSRKGKHLHSSLSLNTYFSGCWMAAPCSSHCWLLISKGFTFYATNPWAWEMASHCVICCWTLPWVSKWWQMDFNFSLLSPPLEFPVESVLSWPWIQIQRLLLSWRIPEVRSKQVLFTVCCNTLLFWGQIPYKPNERYMKYQEKQNSEQQGGPAKLSAVSGCFGMDPDCPRVINDSHW